MLDLELTSALVLFIVGGYGVVKLAGWLWRSAPRSSVLWCARMKCFSVVDTEVTSAETAQSEKVTDCLLWPELRECDQRCVKPTRGAQNSLNCADSAVDGL